MRQLRQAQSGQAFGEYAILVAGIAIACVFTVLLLGALISGRFHGSGERQGPGGGAFTPPVARSDLTWPTARDQCQDDRWRNYPQFVSEDDCTRYVDSLQP